RILTIGFQNSWASSGSHFGGEGLRSGARASAAAFPLISRFPGLPVISFSETGFCFLPFATTFYLPNSGAKKKIPISRACIRGCGAVYIAYGVEIYPPYPITHFRRTLFSAPRNRQEHRTESSHFNHLRCATRPPAWSCDSVRTGTA